MSIKHEIRPVEKKETVAVYMLIEVTDCYHMDELFMAVAAVVPMMQNKKIKLLDCEIEIIDPETGELKYAKQPLMTCSSSLIGTEDIVWNLNTKGQILNSDNLVVYDVKEDLE